MSGYKGVCICYMAIFALPGGYSLGTFPTNFGEFVKAEVQLRRIPLLGNSVNKALLVCLLTLRGRLGAQPQRDVGRLHRLPYHVYQFVVQRLQVRLVP
jgi:hypothetical protein